MAQLLRSETGGANQPVQQQEQGRLKAGLLAILEVGLVYVLLQTLMVAWRSTGWFLAEVKLLGWSYTAMVIFVAVPALVIWLTHRSWADYGVTLSAWPTNLDIGLKACLVALIPLSALSTSVFLNLGYTTLRGGLILAVAECFAIAVMLLVLRRQRPVASGRKDLIIVVLLLLFPIASAGDGRLQPGDPLDRYLAIFVFRFWGGIYLSRLPAIAA